MAGGSRLALLVAATLPLAHGALTDGLLVTIAVASFAIFSFTRIDSVWVILASALGGLLSAAFASG